MLSPLCGLLLLLLSFHHTVDCSSVKQPSLSFTISATPTNGSCIPHIVLDDFLNHCYIFITLRTSKGQFDQLTVFNNFNSCSLPSAGNEYLAIFSSKKYLAIFRNCSPEQRGTNRLHRLPACSVAEQSKETAEDYYYYTTKRPDVLELNCTTLVYSPSDRDGGTGNLVGVDMVVVDSWTEHGRCSGSNHVVSQSFGCTDPEDFPTRNTTRGKQHKAKIKKELIFVGLPILGCSILLIVSLCFYVRLKNISINKKKKSNRRDKDAEGIFMKKFQKVAPKRYSYSDVEKITSCFSDKLGQGGYGSVYRGQLDDGRPVAAKVLNDTKGSVKDFFTEVVSIGCTYHVNIVTLLGFCLEGTRRVLIYEFMANGSLAKFISDRKQTSSHLDAGMLLEIATGVARGLEYLHHGCSIRILHFDIKPHNILLDEHFCPKIADFGLAKLCRSANKRVKMSGARGTVGYIAPEVFSRQYGAVSSKSDVYSFGMMVLEMVGGRSNLKHEVDRTSEICFPHWICRHLDLDGKLKSLRSLTEVEGEMARRMVIVGLQCIQMKPSDRPTMTKVLDMLEGRVTELQMPPMGSVDRIEGIQFPESINVSGPTAHVSESG